MIAFIMLLVEITTEKEKKLRLGMQMMGLSATAYWVRIFFFFEKKRNKCIKLTKKKLHADCVGLNGSCVVGAHFWLADRNRLFVQVLVLHKNQFGSHFIGKNPRH